MSVDVDLRRAASLRKKRQNDKAAVIYRQILEKFPQNQRAVDAFREMRTENILSAVRAKQLTPTHLQLLIDLCDSGYLDDAAYAAEILMKAFPKNARLANIAGVVFSNQEQFGMAVTCFEKSLNLKPGDTDTYSNLGNALLGLGNIEQARIAFEMALEIDPSNVFALNNFGRFLTEQHMLAEAEDVLLKARSLAPANVDVLSNLGGVFVETGRFEEALLFLNEALKRQPDYWRVHKNLAVAMLRLDRKPEALQHYRETDRLNPGLDDVEHMIAALSGDGVARASTSYVEALFDGYAADFDANLVEQLDYKLPLEVSELLGETLDQKQVDRVLDLGCGTGLLGSHIRPFTQALIGVDLSARMLVHAEQTGLYDELIKADAHSYLLECKLSFDVVIALDVLIYIGALEELFERLSTVCTLNSRIVLSTEILTGGEMYKLLETGRYAHSDEYVINCAAKHGFVSEIQQETVIRMERGTPISGRIHSFRRSG